MISVSLGDIVKALESVPVWKQVVGLIRRVDALEERVRTLESGAAKPAANLCPICESGRLKVIAARPDRKFGALGVQQHDLKCDNPACAHSEQRLFDPDNRMGNKK